MTSSSVRDRLAEALFTSRYTIPWKDVAEGNRTDWRGKADALLALLPSVGLTPPAISTDPQDDGGRG